MLLDSNTDGFGTLARHRYECDKSDPKLALGKYSKRMYKDKEWGSDVKIIVAATMLQINVLICELHI